MTTTQRLNNSWLYFGIIALVIVVAYSKIFSAGFISWDDTEYVLNNADVHAFGLENLKLWFSRFYIGNYHPLTMLSYAIDYSLGRQSPLIYHSTNLLLHIINAGLVYAVFSRIADNKLVGLFTALLFALHPSQTESVSWIAERKNVLYAFFFLLAIYWYLHYLNSHRPRDIIIISGIGVCAMLCKGTAVALPLALVAVDIWRGRALNDARPWLEKMPLFIAALIFGIVAISAQEEGGFLKQAPHPSLLHSVVYAGYAWCAYILRLIVPAKLSVLYPHPQGIEVIHIVGAVVSLSVIAACIWLYRKGERILVGGILFYTVNIMLVLQFIQFGKVLTADRYIYIPSIGIFFPLVYYIIDFSRRKSKALYGHITLAVIAASYLLVTFSRNDIWQSEKGFWQAIVETFPESSVAQSSMAGVLMKEGAYAQAVVHADKAIEIDPQNSRAWYNKAVIYQRMGRLNESFAALNQSVVIEPMPKSLFMRGMMLEGAGKTREALADFELVLAEEPGNARALYFKGKCLEDFGNLQGALDAYSAAIANNSEEAVFYMQRGLLYARGSQFNNAMTDLSKAIDLNPKEGQAWYWRGILKSNIGRNPCDDLQQALQLGFQEARQAIGKMCGSL